MSTTAERLFYPIKRTARDRDYQSQANHLAAELAAENLVLASREDVRLAIEVALRDEYSELEQTEDDAFRKRVDVIARATFTELERSA